MSKLEVREIGPISGETDLTLGQSGGTVTLADGATAVGFGGGKILQSVNYLEEINSSTTSSTYVDSGISMSITPESDSSLLIWSLDIPFWQAGGNTPLKILLNGTPIIKSTVLGQYFTGRNFSFSGVYTNLSTEVKTITMDWYKASTGSSNSSIPKIGDYIAWGSGAPALPHINDTTGYIIEVEQ